MKGKRLGLRSTQLCILAILMILPVVLATPAGAVWHRTSAGTEAPVTVEVIESSGERIVLDIVIGGFDAEPVQIEGRTYYDISLPGESRLLGSGLPELPHVSRSVIIPDRGGMAVRMLDVELEEYPGLPVVPSKGNLSRTVDPATVPYVFGAAYASSEWFPDALARGGEPYILRDYRGMTVEALPFQARGSDGTLRVARHMTIEIVSSGPDMTNAIDRVAPPQSVVDAFQPIYEGQFVNYGMDRYTPVGERGRMLIISYHDFLGAVQPLVDWKLQEGMPTQLIDVSTIGNTAVAIKNAIQASYDAGGLAFVLLVGDGTQVASPQAAGGSSDPSYSLLAGTDRYPELLVGRFSAETVAQVQTQVARTIDYEKTPAAGGVWYAKGTGVASAEGPGDDGEYDYQHVGNIRTRLLAYGYTHVDEIYDPTGTASMVTNALNEGRSIINYCGHGSQTSWGSTGFSNTHVNALVNDNLLPFIFSVACVNGQFEGATCFAEAWMRATHNGNPTGAIGTYMSSINQSWNPPMCAEDACDDLLVQDQKHTFGALCYNGSCQMMDEYGAVDGGNEFLTWHVFGDPSLLVRSKTPQAMIVQHDGTLLIGQPTYEVRVMGVSGALCALYGNGTLYGSVHTDALGMASIHPDPAPAEPMTLSLTVTAYNKLPVIAPVEVLPPSGPYVTYESSLIADGDAGDGDGSCEAGESVSMTITLKNVGVETATGVTGDLTEDDPYVEIQQPSQSYGDIQAGGTATSQAPYGIVVSPQTPDGHVVELALAIHANEGDWNRAFPLTVTAPVIAYVSHVADDSPPLGNGTGWIVPGEMLRIPLVLRNDGQGHCIAPVATLQPDSRIQILNGVAGCAGIPGGGQETLSPFEIAVHTDCPSPTTIDLTAVVTDAYGYTGTVAFQLSIGGFLDDCEMSRGWTIGAPGDNASTGLWVQADPNGTTYGGNGVQPEDDHTVDPGTRCYVTGNGSVGGTAGEADLDGGKTTLTSPVFDLHAVPEASVSYWVWYTNDLGNNPGQDYWTVQVTSDGTNWVDLERTTQSTNAWAQRTFPLQQYVTLTDRVQLRFVADDQSPNSLVEALVDDFTLVVVEEIQSGDASDLPARTEFALDGIAPNPATGRPEIRFYLPREAPASIRIYDVTGRLVRTLGDGRMAVGAHRVLWDRRNDAGRPVGAGIYFVRMRADGFRQVRSLALIR
jgi:hypothetical protein